MDSNDKAQIALKCEQTYHFAMYNNDKAMEAVETGAIVIVVVVDCAGCRSAATACAACVPLVTIVVLHYLTRTAAEAIHGAIRQSRDSCSSARGSAHGRALKAWR